MALIHGSRGLIYFVHQVKPSFREAARLDDAEMLAAVTKLNIARGEHGNELPAAGAGTGNQLLFEHQCHGHDGQ